MASGELETFNNDIKRNNPDLPEKNVIMNKLYENDKNGYMFKIGYCCITFFI